MKGILGQKAGMTQVFSDQGVFIPVTVLSVKDNVVSQVKTMTNDGYNALQLATGEQKKQRVVKAQLGHYQKAKISTPKFLVKEIKNMSGFKLGEHVKAIDLFEVGEFVDVTGVSKGKGFAGVIKRHNAAQGPMSHGSQFHRSVGSMSDIEGNRVYKGKKMPGQMGREQKTIQNLEIIDINDKEKYMLIKGAVPGFNSSYVVIKSAIKNPKANLATKLVSYHKQVKTKESKIVKQNKPSLKEKG